MKKIIALAGACLFVVSILLVLRDINNELTNRFPDIDRAIIKLAYKNMVAKAAAGEYGDVEDLDDDDLDTIFIREVSLLENP